MHLQRCNSLYFTVNCLKSYLLKILMAVRKTEQIITPSRSFFDSLVCYAQSREPAWSIAALIFCIGTSSNCIFGLRRTSGAGRSVTTSGPRPGAAQPKRKSTERMAIFDVLDNTLIFILFLRSCLLPTPTQIILLLLHAGVFTILDSL